MANAGMTAQREQALLTEWANGMYYATDLLGSTEWLSKNNVTLDENAQLSVTVAMVVAAFRNLPPLLQTMILAQGHITLEKWRKEHPDEP